MSIKQRLKRTADVATDQLSDEEFAKYLVDSLGLKVCAWMLEDFFWGSDMAQDEAEAESHANDMLKPFGLKIKDYDEYTDEELDELEANEIYEIATDEYVGCTDSRAIGDIADGTYKRANNDNMAQALIVCMNLNRELLDELAANELTNTFNPLS